MILSPAAKPRVSYFFIRQCKDVVSSRQELLFILPIIDGVPRSLPGICNRPLSTWVKRAPLSMHLQQRVAEKLRLLITKLTISLLEKFVQHP